MHYMLPCPAGSKALPKSNRNSPTDSYTTCVDVVYVTMPLQEAKPPGQHVEQKFTHSGISGVLWEANIDENRPAE